MKENMHLKQLQRRMEQGEHVRLLAFGSSNTQRFIPGMHWFDCLDLAINIKYSRVHHCINAGVGGHTTADLLGRYDRDAAFYRPDLTIITIGGNDCNPVKNISRDDFEKNLYTLHEKLTTIGSFVIFQTYYAIDRENADEERVTTFYKYMDIVRDVASKTDSGLVDHLKRWEPLRGQHYDSYKALMRDAWHVNPVGNLVLGMDLARHFGVDLLKEVPDHFSEAGKYKMMLDELES